jgi:cysteinyl-tRNA synthetase, unknown class
MDPVLDGGTGRVASRLDVEIMRRRPDGGRRLVIAYLAIGAAEEYRPYWNPTWSTEPPVWLGPHNPAWPRSYAVRYWNPEWRQIVMEGLQRIVAAGFDGVFLDRVDAYHDWPGEGESALSDMAEFVAQLSQIARGSQPGFLFIGQNAENLLVNPRYRDAIDAVSKESLLTGLQGPGLNNRSDQAAWSMNYLVPAQRAGLTILAIEYLESPADIEIARRRHRAMGFAPFFGNRLFDRLP